MGLRFPCIPRLKLLRTMTHMSNKGAYCIGQGARQMYSSHLQPFLLKHQARMDLIVEFVYGAMSKIISAYKPELELARTLAVKFLMTATQMIRNFIHPVGRELNDIEPQKRQVQDSESEEE
ncbi:HVA22-like protein k [Glycine max]|nr:HVA22-like protein k [Glycine max]